MAFTQIPSLNSPSPVKAKLFRLFRVGISAPAVLRLGFHDCLKYKDGTGGCDGCLNWHGMGVKSLFWIFLFYLNIQVAPIWFRKGKIRIIKQAIHLTKRGYLDVVFVQHRFGEDMAGTRREENLDEGNNNGLEGVVEILERVYTKTKTMSKIKTMSKTNTKTKTRDPWEGLENCPPGLHWQGPTRSIS